MTQIPPKPAGRLARTVRMATTRPRLFLGAAIGILAWLALDFAPGLRWSTRAILAWDAGVFTAVIGMMIHMADKRADDIRASSAEQDEGQGMILTIVIIACIASLATVAAELNLAKDARGLEKGLRVSLASVTVAASWFLVQLIFALHYAHEFYSANRPGGLLFPGPKGEDPDYWDFIHFSVVIGAAAQTADIAFTSKLLRRIGTLHTLIAFTFNTVVLALSINLLASLV
jgi:uncharacterized membrane protein